MNDSESLRFACPLCGQHIECTNAWAGVELDCPACTQRIRAPVRVSAAMSHPAPLSPLPPVWAVSSPLKKRADPAARSLRSWIQHAGTYGIAAPIIMLGFGAVAAPFADSMKGVFAGLAAFLFLFLFVSGCLAAFAALVHCSRGGKGFPKALIGIGINLFLGIYMIWPASHRAWHRHKEIQWERATGVRQLHEQGMYYITNRVLPRSERAKGVQLLTESANRGFTSSQYSLGNCYRNGIGAATNRVLACKWWTIAAKDGSTKARGLLPQLRVEMSAEETAEAQRLVKEFAVKLRQAPPGTIRPARD